MESEFASNAVFYKVDVDDNAVSLFVFLLFYCPPPNRLVVSCQVTAERCKVNCMPTFQFFKNGQKVRYDTRIFHLRTFFFFLGGGGGNRRSIGVCGIFFLHVDLHVNVFLLFLRRYSAITTKSKMATPRMKKSFWYANLVKTRKKAIHHKLLFFCGLRFIHLSKLSFLPPEFFRRMQNVFAEKFFY